MARALGLRYHRGMAKRIGGYTIQGELGQGGMGVTYRAWSERHQRQVALKLCKPGLATVEECARLVREGRVLAGIDHPFVVGVLDAGEHLGVPYLVMELVEGEDLRGRLRRGPLEPLAAARLVRQVAEGVAQLHARGVVHRDLKPENVLLDRRGSPRVCDLGLARGDELSRLTATGDVLGTPAFLAPEQAQGQRVGPPADVYSMGAMLFELVTGAPPFTGGLLEVLTAHVQSPAPRLRDRCPQAPRGLEEVVARCLEKDPGDRYRDASELARALSSLGSAGAAGTGGHTRRAGLALLALVALLGGVAWWSGRGSSSGSSPGLEQPSSFAAELERGEAALYAERFGAAREAYLRARDLDPRSAIPWAGLARVAVREGDTREQIACFERALELDPHERYALMFFAVRCAVRGEFEPAARYLETCREAHGRGPELEVVAAQVAGYRDGGEAALARIRAWTEAHPEDAEPWFFLGELLCLSGEWEEGLACMRRACDLEPERMSMHEAKWIEELSRSGAPPSEVREAIEAALARHPSSVALACRQADYVYAQLNADLDRACRVLRDVIEREPRALEPRLVRAEILTSARRRLHVAHADLAHVLERAPNEGAVWSVRRKLAEVQDDWQGACWAAREHVTSAVGPGALESWARCARLAGRPLEVDRAAALLWDLRPSAAVATRLVGEYLLGGRPHEASRWLNEALELAPGSATLSNLGACIDVVERRRPADVARVQGLLTGDLRLQAGYSLLIAAAQGNDPRLAIPVREALTAEDLSDPALSFGLALVALKESRFGVYLERLDHVLSCQPDHVLALSALAGLYDVCGGRGEARSLAEFALRIGQQRGANGLGQVQSIVGAGAPGLVAPEELFAEPAVLLRSAQDALDAYETGRAHVLGRALVARDPRNAEGWLVLARVAARRRLTQQAQRAVDRALATEPSLVGAVLQKGRLLASAGDVVGLREVLARVERLDPDGIGRHELALSLGVAERQPSAALLTRAEDTLRRFPSDPYAVLGLAAVARRLDPGRAARVLEDHLRASPASAGRVALVALLASLHEDQGELDRAEQAWQTLELGSAEHRRALESLARYRLQRDDFDGALSLAQRALAEDFCLDPRLWHLVGVCQRLLDRPREARESLAWAHAFASSSAEELEALRALLRLASEEGEPAAIRRWAEELVRAAPEVGEGHWVLAQLAHEEGRAERACEHARRALGCEDLEPRQRSAAEGLLERYGQR